MELKVFNCDQTAVDQLEVSEAIFDRPYNESLVHQVVSAYMTNARQGTRAQKTRAEVRGGGVKPWKQKGTGRARAGSSRSPLWRTGGVIFAAKPQDHSQKTNRKMYRAAMSTILSELIRQERLVIVDHFALETHKTREMIAKLKAMNLSDVLLILPEVDEKLYLASRNVYGVDVRDPYDVDVVSLVAYRKVLMTPDVLKSIEERLV